jgi:hypothetical protein
MMIVVALVLTFLPDVAEGGAALAGYPELAPLAGNVARKAGGPRLSFAPTVRSANEAIAKQERRAKQNERRQAAAGIGRKVRVASRNPQTATTRPSAKAQPSPSQTPAQPKPTPEANKEGIRQRRSMASLLSNFKGPRRQAAKEAEAKRAARKSQMISDLKSSEEFKGNQARGTTKRKLTDEQKRRSYLAGDKNAFNDELR